METIADIVKKANELGMTYGKYVSTLPIHQNETILSRRRNADHFLDKCLYCGDDLGDCLTIGEFCCGACYLNYIDENPSFEKYDEIVVEEPTET